ncbi:MAG: hypothetical protein ACK5SL_05830 [Cyclobacteriaceae bacterium]
MLYSKADVVKAFYSWIENGQKKGIVRPVIIKEAKENLYFVVKISRSNKKEGLIRVSVDSAEWREMGLYHYSHDSFIERNATQWISESEIQRKIGRCPLSLFALI